MASAQVMSENDKQQKAIVEQMVEKAKSFALSEQNSAVSMYNDTKATMILKSFHVWSGMSIKPPSTIEPHSSVQFRADCSAAAVLYFGYNELGVSCGWVLAWSAPTDSSENKVYVECGPSSKYDPVDWNAIHAKLNASYKYSGYFDLITKTTARGQIVAGKGYAVVGANFGEMK